MKILFATAHFGFLRNFEHGLRELARRGHHLHLLADRRDSLGGMRTVQRLTDAYPDNFTHAYAGGAKRPSGRALATGLRLTLDYWRYLDPRYDAAPALRARAAEQAPAATRSLSWHPLFRAGGVRQALHAGVRFVERGLPVHPMAFDILEASRPDVVAVTPLLYFGSQQVDYVRAARMRGIPSMLCVGSWDHLTTKGLVHEVPDVVTVWNEAQRAEAQAFHGIDPSRVRVTGAQSYDHWFSMQPRMLREAFLGQVGLPDRPYLLYLCSSPFIAPHEVGFVRAWIEGFRRHAEPRLRDLSLLIRPHPQNAAQWRDVDLSDLGPVAIWPRAGANPVDEDARADYFHSMFFSEAVVGVNTSAQIESGIVGRPVFAIRAAEFARTQEGTLHFQYLKSSQGGLVTFADGLAEHHEQIRALLDEGADRQPRGRAFIEYFVRPRGLDHSAAGFFADAVEEAARLTPAPMPPLARTRVLGPVFAGLEALAERRRGRRR